MWKKVHGYLLNRKSIFMSSYGNFIFLSFFLFYICKYSIFNLTWKFWTEITLNIGHMSDGETVLRTNLVLCPITFKKCASVFNLIYSGLLMFLVPITTIILRLSTCYCEYHKYYTIIFIALSLLKNKNNSIILNCQSDTVMLSLHLSIQ